ncbi:MAG: NAD-dependent epimerase/dehydratase family protein [Bacteroidetes bacterium]|nr:NAD-dependent epimerase/dehydratase family protein [Bacteroidota bacterium]GDX48525.1 epimerase [Bacteroidota bacterium]
MKKILITGGAGFIASCLAERLIKNPEHYVVMVDNLLTGSALKLPDNTYKNWRFIKGDVNNYETLSSIMLSHAFDYVFHYAAVVGVQRTLANPVMVLDDITGIRNVLELSKNTGVQRTYFSSSSEVYGEPVEFPQNEQTTPLNSRLPYAIVKNVGESYFKSYQQEFGLDYTIYRFFNTYGPKQSSDFVISKFIRAALAHDDITIYGDGSQTRTFCFIDDHLDATVRAFMENLYVNDVVNIGSDVEIPILEVAKLVIELTKSRSKLVHLPALKEGDMTRRQPDIAKMKQLLSRDPMPLREGIERILKSGLF